MTIKTLHELYVDGLQDVYYAEKQLTKALPTMAEEATNLQLKSAYQSHLQETHSHVERLETVFRMLNMSPKGKTCEAIDGIIEETKDFLSDTKELIGQDSPGGVRDAGLIMMAQKAEHYEIATYGTLIVFAKLLGYTDQADVLKLTIAEEKGADEKLTLLAESAINAQAKQADVRKAAE